MAKPARVAPSPGRAGQEVLRTVAATASALVGWDEREDFIQVIDHLEAVIAQGQRIHLTGIGKAGHIADKCRATWASLDLPATGLHALDALHGDAGQVRDGDVVLIVSHSGRTPEAIDLAETVRGLGASVVVLTHDPTSPLAGLATQSLLYPFVTEGSPLGLPSMASAVAQMTVLDALGAELSARRGFDQARYLELHPEGATADAVRRVLGLAALDAEGSWVPD